MDIRHSVALSVARLTPPHDSEEWITGCAVIGVAFGSGDVLALRDIAASSVGPAYRSVWHCAPDGRWTFYSTAAPRQSCARYFGHAVHANVTTAIETTWETPARLAVSVPGHLDWRLALRTTPATRLLGRIAGAVPAAAWREPRIARALGRAAGFAAGVGRLNLTGTTPNGHLFMAEPRGVWSVADSHARVAGRDLGDHVRLSRTLALGDFLVPARGLLVTMASRLRRPPAPSAPPGESRVYFVRS